MIFCLDNRVHFTVCINVDLYWMPSLWVEEEGAFRFNDIDYYSPDEDRFVINFNTMAAECLIKLYKATGNTAYENTALRVGEWLVKKCAYARDFYRSKGEASDHAISLPIFGLPYQYSASRQLPDNCVSIYAGLALRGLAALYAHTGDEEYGRIIKETLDFLQLMVDPETHLFYHTTDKGIVEKYPQFISGTGMILIGIEEASAALKKTCDFSTTLDAILKLQYKNGSFPSFIGKNIARKGRSETVWEDAVAAVNWNAQLFEYFTFKIKQFTLKELTVQHKNMHLFKKTFLYFDTGKICMIISWKPLRSIGVFVMKKTNNIALSLSFIQFYRKVRNFLKGGM